MSAAVTLSLLSLVFLFQGTSDLYAASMPAMMRYFNVPQVYIQLTIIIFLLSYGFGQFLWVIFSEKFSRKTIILFNICSFIFGSCLAMYAPSIEILYLARLIQGLAISGLNLNVKAMPLEIFEATNIKIFFTYFALVWGAGGTIAPYIGSNIQHFLGWRYNFGALAIYAIITLILTSIYLPNKIEKFHKINNYSIMDYKTIISNTGFLSGVVAQSCTLSMFLAFNYFMSFNIQNKAHFSEIYFGYVSFFAGLSFVVGCILFRFSISRFNSNKLSIICSLAALTISIALCIINYSNDSLTLTIILICLIIFCSGVMASENIGITMMFFPNKASIASCLHTAIHFIFTSIFMWTLSIFSYNSLLTISIFYFCSVGLFFITNQYCYINSRDTK